MAHGSWAPGCFRTSRRAELWVVSGVEHPLWPTVRPNPGLAEPWVVEGVVVDGEPWVRSGGEDRWSSEADSSIPAVRSISAEDPVPLRCLCVLYVTIVTVGGSRRSDRPTWD